MVRGPFTRLPCRLEIRRPLVQCRAMAGGWVCIRNSPPGAGLRVGLFVTCLVDLMRPSVGFAAVKLLEDAGCKVIVPSQTCCGQPAYNSGDRADAKAIARADDARVRELRLCRRAERLLRRDARQTLSRIVRRRARRLARGGRLRRQMPRADQLSRRHARRDASRTRATTASRPITIPARVCANSACSAQPRKLLATVEGLKLVELEDSDVCCGFGGTFAVKYGELSDAIVAKKSAKIAATGRRYAARRRSRLPDEHGRQDAARGPQDPRSPCRGGAGRNDRRSADRRGSRTNDRRR